MGPNLMLTVKPFNLLLHGWYSKISMKKSVKNISCNIHYVLINLVLKILNAFNDGITCSLKAPHVSKFYYKSMYLVENRKFGVSSYQPGVFLIYESSFLLFFLTDSLHLGLASRVAQIFGTYWMSYNCSISV